MRAEGEVCAHPSRAQGSPELQACQESWLGINARDPSSPLFLAVQKKQLLCYWTQIKAWFQPFDSSQKSGEAKSHMIPASNASLLLTAEVSLSWSLGSFTGESQDASSGCSQACYLFSIRILRVPSPSWYSKFVCLDTSWQHKSDRTMPEKRWGCNQCTHNVPFLPGPSAKFGTCLLFHQ